MDNRPAQFRPTIVGCAHRFLDTRGYCVVCGHGYNQVRENEANVRFGSFLSVLGALIVIASFALKETAFSGGGFGYDWINSWYDGAVALPGNFVVHGADAPRYMLFFGAIVMFLGLTGAVAAKNARPVAYTAPVRKAKPLSPMLAKAGDGPISHTLHFARPTQDPLGNTAGGFDAKQEVNCPDRAKNVA